MLRLNRVSVLILLALLFGLGLIGGSYLWFTQTDRADRRELSEDRARLIIREADLTSGALSRVIANQGQSVPSARQEARRVAEAASAAIGRLRSAVEADEAVRLAAFAILPEDRALFTSDITEQTDTDTSLQMLAELRLLRAFTSDRLQLRREDAARARLAAYVAAGSSIVALIGLLVIGAVVGRRTLHPLDAPERARDGQRGSYRLTWRDASRRVGSPRPDAFKPVQVSEQTDAMGIAVIPEGDEPPLVNAQMSRMLEDADLELSDLPRLGPEEGEGTRAFRLAPAALSDEAGDEATFQLQATRVRAQGLIADVHLLKPVEQQIGIDRAERILAVASHELRAPATALLSLVESVLDDPAGGISGAQRLRLELAVRRGISLHRIIDDLLVFSRANAQIALPLYRRRTDLTLLAGDLVESARLEAEPDGIAVELDGEAVVAHVDPARISQVIGNLLDNAIRFAPRQSSIWVHISRPARSRQALIEIRDEGPGFSDAALEGLFVPFRHDGDYPGLGLGLFVVKTIVDAHGGSIDVCGKEGGAMITITLPLDAPYDFIARRSPPPPE